MRALVITVVIALGALTAVAAGADSSSPPSDSGTAASSRSDPSPVATGSAPGPDETVGHQSTTSTADGGPATTDRRPTSTGATGTADDSPAKTTADDLAKKLPEPELSLSLEAAPKLPGLAPGRSETSSGRLTITSVRSSWTLRVDASDSGGGHMHPATGPECEGSTRELAHPLSIRTVSHDGSAAVDLPDYDLRSQDGPQLAHGTSSSVLEVSYTQAVGAHEPLREGCTYGVTLTWTLAAA